MNETNTLGSAYKYLTRELTVSEIENPQLEARILLAFAARVEQTRVIGYPEDKLDNTVIRNLGKIKIQNTHLLV